MRGGNQMKLAYARVSSTSQNLDRQIEALEKVGVQKIYTDKGSGKDTNREQLQELLSYAREGDSIVVTSISRFARNTQDLLKLMELLKEKKVEFISLKEQVNTSTPSGRFFLTMMGAMAELERDYIKERQREGIEIAKAKGIKFGRREVGDEALIKEVAKIYHENSDMGLAKAADMAGVSRSTFYRRYLKLRKEGMIQCTSVAKKEES